jgi:hypothetical protein
MQIAQYLIIAAGAFAAGLALGPIIPQRSRRFILAGGLGAGLIGAALEWSASWGIVSDLLSGIVGETLAADLMQAGLFGIAAVLLPLAFGAAVTGT